MKKLFLTLLLAAVTLSMTAQSNDGSISPEMMSRIKASFKNTSTDKMVRNAIAACDTKQLSVNQENRQEIDDKFSNRVPNKGITDQKRSGRCWLFSGLNVLRSKAIARYELKEFQFSQAYIFFYDQLEKSNLFLQMVIDTRKEKIDCQSVEWLFSNPIGDGGTFTGVADLVNKYGLVPSCAMPESKVANATSQMSDILKTKLRMAGINLRDMADRKASMAELLQYKEQTLCEVYRILALCLGTPPTTFTYQRNDSSESKTYTPMEFAAEYGTAEICNDYIMLMNDPTREYYRCYEIDRDRHTYEGHNWLYVNLPIEDIKQMAIASIKDSTAMYFSCDVAKFLDKDRGLLDVANYNYEDLWGVNLQMDKRQRIASRASGSSHAMTLVAVDLKDDKPTKWMVENSWGATAGHKGHLIMTDEWFNEYMFRIVICRKYATQRTLEVLKTKPIKLPSWDPMFAAEE
ncbi:MAG: C1 family peptidase [Paludibacteraceae bacterium]|nr:C1 family peptidase [Paludibacteraceae bacterium]